MAAAHVTRLAVLVIAGAWGGSVLDDWFATSPALFLTGLLVGTIAGFTALIQGMQEQAPPDDPEPPNAA